MSDAGRRPSILFVDDEADVLAGIRTALRRQRREWHMVFSVGAEDAVKELSRGAFRVIVSDMRMPGMDGAELLERARALCPEAVRIVLSGQADERQTVRALSVCQQWLSKPCGADELVAAIRRALSAHERMRDPRVGAVVGGTSSLPAFPRLANALRELLMDPECAIEDVAKLVEGDPAIATRVLQLVNSGFFALPRQLTDISEGVRRLGLQTLSRLVLAEEVFSLARSARSTPPWCVDDLVRRARLGAAIAGEVACEAGIERPDAVSAALLREVGRLLLSNQATDEQAAAVLDERQRGIGLSEAEERVLGARHDCVGSALLASWGLPLALVEATAHHERPGLTDEATRALPTLVHAVAALVAENEARQRGSDPILRLDSRAVVGVVQPDRLEHWRAVADELAASGELCT